MSLQTPVLHHFSFMWDSYSSLKYFIVVRTGLGAVCPRPQREVAMMSWDMSLSSSISPPFPFPSEIFVRRSSITVVPILQGGHLPQDSSAVNSRKNLATL